VVLELAEIAGNEVVHGEFSFVVDLGRIHGVSSMVIEIVAVVAIDPPFSS
jgi:hypothetical protein